MAVNLYDQKSRTIIYDSDIYDSVQKEMDKKTICSNPGLIMDLTLKSHKVVEYKNNGCIYGCRQWLHKNIIEHKSPEFAVLFKKNYKEADSFFRQKDLDDANALWNS